MTEISSKSDAKFTDGLAGVSNNKGPEGDISLFDDLFGVISEGQFILESDDTLLSSTLDTTDENSPEVGLMVSVLPDISHLYGSHLNNIVTHNVDGSNSSSPSFLAGSKVIELTLKHENINLNKEDGTDLLNKLVAALKKAPMKISETDKNPTFDKNDLDTKLSSQEPIKENRTILKQPISEGSLDKAYKSRSTLINVTNPFPGKNGQEMLNIETNQVIENSSKTILQMPKLAYSSTEKEMFKVDSGQSSVINQSNSSLSSSNNTNSGGSMNSGGFSNSNSTTVLEHLNMLDKSWGKNLLNRVQTALQNGDETIELALRPKNLGKIKIALSLHQEGAKISIVTETASAALLLAESEGKLSQMLEGSGLKLSNLNTSSENGKKGNSDQNNNEKSQNEKQNKKKEPEATELSSSIGAAKAPNETINLIA